MRQAAREAALCRDRHSIVMPKLTEGATDVNKISFVVTQPDGLTWLCLHAQHSQLCKQCITAGDFHLLTGRLYR